jgi:hypothetical protein
VAPYLRLAQDIGASPRSLQRDRRDLYSSQWGLSVQQELPRAFVAQIGYVGSAAAKVTTRRDENVLDEKTRTRPLPTFGAVDGKRNDGSSNFNALQLSLNRRVGRGLNWGTEYMWSHSINDGSTGGGEGRRPQAQNCRACERSNSDQDVRHTITSNWVYELPFGAGQKYLADGLASKAFGGWELSGIWTMRTGRPLNIAISRSSNDLPDGNSRDPRPNLVPGVSLYPAGGSTFSQWFNPAAFAIPASRTWGNLARHIGRGPGLAQVDFALQKKIRIVEGKELSFRIESFNISNRTQPGDPGTNFSSPASFGVINSGLNRTIGTGTSRQLQVAARLNF